VEAYHTLRTNLKLTLLKDKSNVVAFTSAGIGEGKTISASNFALAAAQSGLKTLLVEADLRPAVHTQVIRYSQGPGFSDCLIGVKKWKETLRGTTDIIMSELSADIILHYPGIENLRIMTSGPFRRIR